MAEAIKRNGGKGLKNISEENLEKMHKVVRQLREKGARLLSMLANLTDVFRKVNAKSDPVVRTVKPPVTCKHCHQVGHSTRGCKVLAAERNPQELSEDDVAFWSYVKLVHYCTLSLSDLWVTRQDNQNKYPNGQYKDYLVG